MSTHQESNTEDNDSVKSSTQSGNTEHVFWKDWKFWTPIAIPVMMQLIMIVHVSVKHSDVENIRKRTDLIETAWEKRKETLLADLEESRKFLRNVLHQKLEETMTENMKMQERKIEDKLGECHGMKDSLKKIQNQLDGTGEQMKTLENNVAKAMEKIEEVNKQMKTLENYMTETKEKVEETNKQMKTLENDMTKTKGKVEETNKQMKTLGKNTTNIEEKVEGMNNEIKTLENNMTENKEKVEEAKKQMKKLENNINENKGKVEETNEQIKTLENNMTKIEGKVKGANRQMETLENDMTKTGGKVKGVETHMKTLQNDLFKTKGRVDEKDEEIKNINNYFACFLLAEVIHIIFGAYMYTLLKPTGIYKKTGPRHGIDVHRLVLIQSSEDLMDVEPHKLVIIFVDFNIRNIILENTDTEIGDLRNQTTKQFPSLKCDVFVVYCKDKGSQDLPPDNLYNPRLHTIERHPVLSELKRNNRILSINDKFHPHQVELLKKCC